MKYLFVIALASFMVSCSSFKTLSVEYEKPAELRLSDDINKFVLVNHTTFSWDENLNKSKKKLTSLEIINAAMMRTVISAKRTIENSPRITQKNVGIVNMKRVKKDTTFASVPHSDLKKIFNKSGADVIVVLEDFWMNDAFVEVNNRQKYQVNCDCLWRVYIKKDGNIIFADEYSQNDKVSWKQSYSSPESNYVTRLAYNEAALKMGYRYAIRVVPDKVISERLFFANTKKTMRDAEDAFYAKKYEDAINYWMPLLEEKKHETATKAAMNIALAYELNNSILAAIKYAKIAEKKSTNSTYRKYAKIYIEELEKRRNYITDLAPSSITKIRE